MNSEKKVRVEAIAATLYAAGMRREWDKYVDDGGEWTHEFTLTWENALDIAESCVNKTDVRYD